MTPRFFGYGSLVNTATHDYPEPQKAKLTGWRRVWRQTDIRELAFLSVEPCEDSDLLGLTAEVPGTNWAALDQREFAYSRHDISHQIAPYQTQTAVYVVDQDVAGRAHPILLSYLDVVVQGYLHQFGEDGAHHFFDTTHGWDIPILNDRAAPRYPRAQVLSPTERGLVDELLKMKTGR